jgi:hypothetical protein
MGGMRHFVDDDAGYLAWLAGHPADFVINTGRSPSAAYLMLHRASCRTISGTPARGSTFTGDYTKICGDRGNSTSSPASSAAQPAPAVCAWASRRVVLAVSCGQLESTDRCVTTWPTVPAAGCR